MPLVPMWAQMHVPRRIVTAVGAAFLAGGVGILRLASAQQAAAGDDAARWWTQGVTEHARVTIRSLPARVSTPRATPQTTFPSLPEAAVDPPSTEDIIARLTAVQNGEAETVDTLGLLGLLAATAVQGEETGTARPGRRAHINRAGLTRLVTPTRTIFRAGLCALTLGAGLVGLGLAAPRRAGAAGGSHVIRDAVPAARRPLHARRFSGLPISSGALDGTTTPHLAQAEPREVTMR